MARQLTIGTGIGNAPPNINLSAPSAENCGKFKDDICGSNMVWWVVIAILVLIIVIAGGYLGYKYWSQDLCFRDKDKDSDKCPARTA